MFYVLHTLLQNEYRKYLMQLKTESPRSSPKLKASKTLSSKNSFNTFFIREYSKSCHSTRMLNICYLKHSIIVAITRIN